MTKVQKWGHPCPVDTFLVTVSSLVLLQLMTDFGSEAEVQQLFNVFSNVLQDNTSGVAKSLNDQSFMYYWQVSTFYIPYNT